MAGVATKNTSGSLGALQVALKKRIDEADQLVRDQADNQRHRQALEQAIEVISQNLDAFETDGDQLRERFELAEEKIDHELQCVVKHLDQHADPVKDAYQEVQVAIDGARDAAEALAGKLIGPLPLATQAVAENADQNQANFQSLSVGNLTTRLDETQSLIDEADSIKGTSPADYATQYALLSLARDRLTWSPLPNETFAFPADYEKELVAAFNKMNAAADASLQADAELEQGKTDHALAVEQAASLVASRKVDAIKSVTEAV